MDISHLIEDRVIEIKEKIAELKVQEQSLEDLQTKIDQTIDEAACDIAEARRDRISQAEYEIDDAFAEVGLDTIADAYMFDELECAIMMETDNH